LKACDIVIYERELVHIHTYHGKELEKLGLSALEFVEIIISKFNEVYEGRENRKLLVVKGNDKSHYAVVELTFDDEKYKIKTAISVETKRLSKWKLLCANLAH